MVWRAGPTVEEIARTCGTPPHPICEWVYERTGSPVAGRIAQAVVGVPLQIVLIGLLAWVLARLARRVIRRSVGRLARTQVERGRVALRTETVGSVLTSSATAVIWFVATLTIVSSLGVQLTAFIAGASIVGAALAFGAQQLIRDFLTGFFILGEDQYGVGDIIDVGHATGTVEKVSLRTTRLRDVEGRVWHIPHGQIVRVANLSQEWAQTVVDVPVPRDADLAAVTDVLAELAGSLRTDPTVADSVLDDPTVVGVQAVRDDRVLVRVTVRTRPAGQWAVARALWTRLLAAEREGRLPAPPVAPFPPTG